MSLKCPPHTALLLVPALSSTASLLFAFDQTAFLSILTHPSLATPPNSSNRLISSYYQRFFNPGLIKVVTFLGLTTWSSVGAIYATRNLLNARGSLAWYAGAAALAVGHLAYTPAVMYKIKSLVDGEGNEVELDEQGRGKGGKKSNVDVLNDWIWWNQVRTFTTDLGAWVCAVVAVHKTITG